MKILNKAKAVMVSWWQVALLILEIIFELIKRSFRGRE